MGRNVFPINAAAVNSLNQNGVPFVFPAAPAVVAGFRALRHEALIARDGQPATLRTLEPSGAYVCIMAEKRLRNQEGSTPLRHQQKMGYISPVALARSNFTGRIRSGDTVTTEDVIWHVDEAYLQKVADERVRWVLKISESGTA